MTAPDAPQRVELREEVALAIAVAMEPGVATPCNDDYSATDIAIAITVERCAQVADAQRDRFVALFAKRFAEDGIVKSGDLLAFGDMAAEAIATAIRQLAPQPEARS